MFIASICADFWPLKFTQMHFAQILIKKNDRYFWLYL